MSDIIKIPKELITLLATPSQNIVPFTNEIFLLSTLIAGTMYCEDIEGVADEILPELVLTTKRKPDNKYDPMAIAIFYQDIQIGWVPRDENTILARLMDSGKIIICKVNDSEWEDSWFKVKIDVFMVE